MAKGLSFTIKEAAIIGSATFPFMAGLIKNGAKC
jgi:hypothetical protein